MNKHLKIENLTDAELEMLDCIWAFPDKESVEAWMRELPKDKAMLAVSLITLLKVEIIDIENQFTSQSSLADINQYLMKFSK